MWDASDRIIMALLFIARHHAPTAASTVLYSLMAGPSFVVGVSLRIILGEVYYVVPYRYRIEY